MNYVHRDADYLEPFKLAIEDNVPKRVFASLIHISYIYTHNFLAFRIGLSKSIPGMLCFTKKCLGLKTSEKKEFVHGLMRLRCYSARSLNICLNKSINLVG